MVLFYEKSIIFTIIFYLNFPASKLLNRVGYVVTWVTRVRGLNFEAGCVGYAIENIFYVGNILRGSYLLRGLRRSKIFAWVNFFCKGQNVSCESDIFV